MQYYSVSGGWEHQRQDDRWMPWHDGEHDRLTGWFKLKGRRLSMYSSLASGKPAVRFASGKLQRVADFEQAREGSWGTNPGLQPVVDLWGNGIAKLASLTVTNPSVYHELFG